jgi:hypothetical protein
MRSPRSGVTRVRLTPAIVLWRFAHGLITLGFLAAIGVIWRAALTGHSGRWLRPAVASVSAEGLVVALNGGDCPLGPVGDRLGDPVPFFELLLSPRKARRAVPALGAFTGLGIAVLAVRGRPTRGPAISPDGCRSR